MPKIYENSFPPRNLEDAVKAVVAFFDVFDFPLTKEELLRLSMSTRTSFSDLNKVFSSNNKISNDKGYYFIKGRESIVQLRKSNKATADKYWVIVKKYVPLLKYVPFIRAVAVCNTLALNNPDKESDIDVFIITDKKRVNIARVLSTMLFHVLGLRRHHKKIAGRFCLSFFVGLDGLDLTGIRSEKIDVYLSYWVYTLRPVFGAHFFEKLMEQNVELLKFFGQKKYTEIESNKEKDHNVSPIEYLLKGKIGDFIESRLLLMHKKRFEKRLSLLPDNHGIVINDRMLKFHNKDMKNHYNRSFKERYLALLNS